MISQASRYSRSPGLPLGANQPSPRLFPCGQRQSQALVWTCEEDAESVKPDELARHDVGPGERILLNQYLAERRVQTVGVDYLSVGGYRADGDAIHHALLEAGIWVIEGLNLTDIEPGLYELVCMPLKILHADGAPARAALRPRLAGEG